MRDLIFAIAVALIIYLGGKIVFAPFEPAKYGHLARQAKCIDGYLLVYQPMADGKTKKVCYPIAEDGDEKCKTNNDCTYNCIISQKDLYRLGCRHEACSGDHLCPSIRGRCEYTPHSTDRSIKEKGHISFSCPAPSEE